MTTRARKAIIIGGGIAGPATAIFLTRAGYQVEVYEAWPRRTGVGVGLQIAPNGMHVLAELGLDGVVASGGVPSAQMDFFAQSGRHLGAINRGMPQRFGAPAVNISRSALNDIMLAALARDGIAVHFSKRLARIEDRADRPVVAHFEDGDSAEADLLIGADGVHSAVRAHVNPDGPRPFDTGLIGFGGFIPRYLVDMTMPQPGLSMTFGHSGSFGFGACAPDPRNGAMWWSTQPVHGADAAAFRAMDPHIVKQHVQDFHAGWHDPIPRILEAAHDIVITPMLDVATLPAWSRRRVVLIGDAAHATSPHAGQGASLALEDALRLSRLLAGGDELAAAFQRFEDERRPRVERAVALARRNGNQKREFGPVSAWMRDQMLRLMLPLNMRGQDWMYSYDARAAA